MEDISWDNLYWLRFEPDTSQILEALLLELTGIVERSIIFF